MFIGSFSQIVNQFSSSHTDVCKNQRKSCDAQSKPDTKFRWWREQNWRDYLTNREPSYKTKRRTNLNRFAVRWFLEFEHGVHSIMPVISSNTRFPQSRSVLPLSKRSAQFRVRTALGSDSRCCGSVLQIKFIDHPGILDRTLSRTSFCSTVAQCLRFGYRSVS